MDRQLQKPLLIGGLALSAGLLGLDMAQHVLTNMGDVLLLSVTAAGGGYWWLSRRRSSSTPATPREIDRAALEQCIARIRLVCDRLGAAGKDTSSLEQELQQQLTAIATPHYRVAVTGPARSGKSSLRLALPGNVADRAIDWSETAALFAPGDDNRDGAILDQTMAADLLIMTVDGDLTASAYQILEQFGRRQRLLLAFNQQDRYLPADRAQVLQKIQTTLARLLPSKDILGTSSAPTPIKVKAIQADGTVLESIEQPPVAVTPLADRLTQVLTTEGEQLRIASSYRLLNRLEAAAQGELNQWRREQALPKIEQSQWIVGAAAFANPLPALDVLATAAVNVQMIVDLGALYQQKFSLDQAQVLASSLGELLLKLGMVEFATHTIGQVLKTNPTTYAIGGLIQGLSAAYLTRMVGLALVEYLEAQPEYLPHADRGWNLDRLGTILNGVFQANQRWGQFQDLVNQGVGRWVSGNSTLAIPSN